jgi:hypothetical protein
MIIGFTGSRTVIDTPYQTARVISIIEHFQRIREGVKKARHGDCVGWDAKFHNICRQLGIPWIDIHPPVDSKYRAWCKGDFYFPPAHYLKRDETVVKMSDVMLACPSQTVEQFRGSGTWATMRYALGFKKRLFVIWPDGLVTVNSKSYALAREEIF